MPDLMGFKNIAKLDFDNYGVTLTRLANNILATFPNAERFINNFIGIPAKEASPAPCDPVIL